MIMSRLASALVGCVLFSCLMNAQTTALPTAPTSPPPPPDPKILEDGGYSIEPIYWLTQAQPALFGGADATSYGDLSYPGRSKKGLGGEIGIPAGRANTLRISYFRVQGNSSPTLGTASTIFGEAYAAGDYMANSYRVQNAKISWDYLAYTFKNHIRFKTLYEFQWLTISTSTSAPLIAQTYDASTGVTDTNSSTGSKNIYYPTIGGEFEQSIHKNIRWEIKGSAFGLPHHAVIWDTQADIAFRISHVELLIGGKAYHFKTSPNTDQYFTDTLEGAFVGVRYYLGKPQN